MRWWPFILAALVGVAASLATTFLARQLCASEFAGPAAPPPPPPPVPRSKPVDWQMIAPDTDRVPVQCITLADGHAWFVVGTDTGPQPAMVWLFDPVAGKWARADAAGGR